MTIPLLDPKREHLLIREEIAGAWQRVLGSMRLLKGENVSAFEREMAAYLGSAGVVGMASGSDALLLALLGVGVGSGDEVIVHANAFVAAVEAIHYSGAQPVIVDVAADGFGPDVDLVERALTPRTRAVIAVHLYGSPLDLTRLGRLCERHEIALIEDASHAHGAVRDGRKVGSFGRAGCFSCGVVKNLGAYGDADFVATNDGGLMERLQLLRTHGQSKKNVHALYGFNSRLDELQAAVLRVKLPHLDARNRRRQAIADFYRRRFAGLDLRVTQERPGEVHVYHQFVVRTAARDQLQSHLGNLGIETGIHYPVPLHRQPAWLQRYGESPSLNRAERLAAEILSLPVFPDLTDAEIETVADGVVSFFRA